MTSAIELESALNSMANIGEGNVLVTRAASLLNSSYVFSIYFIGKNVQGSVNQLTINKGCISSDPPNVEVVSMTIGDTVSVMTKIEGGKTEIQVLTSLVQTLQILKF